MQARFGSNPGVADLDAFLLAVLVEQPRRVEVQGVALAFARQLLHPPRKQRPETGEVLPRPGEALEKPCERRLARHPLDPEQRRHHRITTQVGALGEFLRAAEQPLHKTENLGDRTEP